MRDAPLALCCAAALAAGCSYDWTVRSQAADAASDVVLAADVGSDATGVDASIDAPPDVAREDAESSVPEAAPLPGCTSGQEATVQQDRAAALVCTGVTPNPCEVLVTDECGCPVYVAAQNQAAATYTTAIEQLKTTCVPSCPPGCGTAPSPGLCILGDAGSGALSCVQ